MRSNRQIVVKVLFDVVTIELHCGDSYAAQVAFDDLADRIGKREMVTITLGPDDPEISASFKSEKSNL